jgi:2-haloacid dehalogenase
MFDPASIRALAFDVFGTVVDWRSGVARETKAMLEPRGHALDWSAFALAWRRQYQPAMEAVRSGARPYVRLDQLHYEMLGRVLADFRVELGEAERRALALAWRRLDPWPDAVAGLTRLKRRFIVAAVSNANLALAVAMAKRAGLPWDVILGAEVARAYKPQDAVYDGAADLLDLRPAEVMMVACHVWDLRAAAARGLRAAFVARPDEYGPGEGGEAPKPGEFDIVASDFIDLAGQLGA